MENCQTGRKSEDSDSRYMLNLKNISKRFDNQTILHPLSLDVTPASTTVLIGPSGCGKSTLLRLIIGLLQPDSGQVSFDGKILGQANMEISRLNMGYMVQEGGLFPHLTIRANVTLMTRHLRWDEKRVQSRLDELTRLVRLSAEQLERFPRELSGGQRQRGSLMRALMLNPDLVLLDEPLGALDPLTRYELQKDLKAIFLELNKTVLLVTHDIGEAAFFGDTIVLLREGKIIQQGGVDDLMNRPSEPFVRDFIQAQRDPYEVLTTPAT